jgi:hypothetical protein
MYRRSYERQKTGSAGAISSPEARVQVTDGVISGASTSSPVAIITTATGFGGAPTVGRKVRVTGTTGSGRYDGLYVVETGSTSGSLVLRCNHNYSLAGSATPASPARFMENSSGITVTLLPSATITLDASGDMEEWFSGSYIFIEAATNPQNNGLWLISHRLTNQTAIISKSWFFTRVGASGLQKNVDDQASFVAETSLDYSIGDREAINPPDAYEYAVQCLIDMGWTLHQERGPNTTQAVFGDRILSTVGEDNSNYHAHNGGNNKKRCFLRCFWGDGSTGNTGTAASGQVGMAFVPFLNWDETLTAQTPGDGTAGLSTSAAALFAVPGSSTSGTTKPLDFSAGGGTGDHQWVLEGSGGFPLKTVRRNFLLFGDRDEVFVGFRRPATSTSDLHQHTTFGFLKTVGNPNVLEVTAAVTAGSLVDINVGSINPAILTPPYVAGDNLTICGYRSGVTKEYVETATIDSVFTPDAGTSYRIRVDTLAQNFGSGSHGIKAQVGEDPFPVFVYNGQSSLGRLHNVSRLNNATGKDWHATNYGTNADPFVMVTTTELKPNAQTNRYGLVPYVWRYSTGGEFRGTQRYMWWTTGYINVGSKLVDRNNNVYVSVGTLSSGVGADQQVIGPMPKALAGVK